MSEKVRYETDGAVATITIARPEVRNAMDVDVFTGLYEAGVRAGADASIRAVVVAGDGPAFSSGIDVSIFAAGSPDGGPFDPLTVDVSFFQRSFSVFEEIPQPTIAAVQGPAFGAGIQLAAACDLRVAGEDATFCVMETRWGIIPDLGGTQRLPRLVGLSRAKDLCFTGRRVDAAEAGEIGLADRVVGAGDHLKAAQELAAELAAQPPLAIEGIKRLANAAFDMPVRAGLEREATIQRRVMASEDFREAVAARFEKRTPAYKRR
ncbi:MAG TPA: enoyl-CoA hydratase-related protein [Actinomycetota bacterium]